MKKYLSVKSVAERYDCATSTVWYWVKAIGFPHPQKIGGNTTRWLASELDKWDKSRERTGGGIKPAQNTKPASERNYKRRI